MSKTRKLQDQVRFFETALSMIDREGFVNFSTRKLAAELEVSPMTLYNYYKSIDDLSRDVLVHGIEKFSKAQYELLVSRLSAGDNPLRYFLLLPGALLEFASAHPNLYEFYFHMDLRSFLPDQRMVLAYQRGFTIVRDYIRDPRACGPIHDHVLLFEITINSLVFRNMRYGADFSAERFHQLAQVAYERLLAPDEPQMMRWESL